MIAMGNNANDVLNVARGEIGYSRWNDPQAGTKYGRWYAELVGSSYFGTSGVPFCAMFVSWVFDQAGASCSGIPGAYCPTMLQASKNAGDVLSNSQSAQPGDVVYFDWDGGVVDHVGIIESNNGSYVTTIEGNTDNGQVKRKTRNWSTIQGVVRPSWGSSPSSSSSRSESSSSSASNQIEVDGQWGPETTRRVQQYLGTTVDGIVSQQYAIYKSQNPGLFSNTWEWVDNPQGGSQMVTAIQQKVGSRADGYIGPNTIKALQSYLGTTVDGCISNPSLCVTALQKALNNNSF